jgi:Ca2+-binding EF-hand superfamily protein
MLRFITVLFLFPLVAHAEVTLPDPVIKKIQKNPTAFLDAASGIVAGFGGEEGLSKDGIDTFIAMERAKARASAMRRMLAMDLDDNGVVAKGELAAVMAAAGAMQRGKILQQHDTADQDRDGQVSAGEMKAAATAAALRSLTAAEADAARGLLQFDGDGNGLVTLDEIERGVALLEDAT